MRHQRRWLVDYGMVNSNAKTASVVSGHFQNSFSLYYRITQISLNRRRRLLANLQAFTGFLLPAQTNH